MTPEVAIALLPFAKFLGAGIAIGAGAIGPGVGIGLIVMGALQAIGRNPEAENSVRLYMFIGIAFAEGVAIYALMITFLLLFVL